MPPAAVSVTLPPAQNVVAPLAVIVAVGAGLTVTLTDAVPLQPVVESVTVTVYVPPLVTVIDRVFSFVDHTYDVPALAVSVALPPAQNDVGPLIVGVNAPTFTLCEAVAEQLFASVTCTV